MEKVLLPWNAAALPEIMAGALQESKCGVPVIFHEGRAAGLQPGSVAGARGGGGVLDASGGGGPGGGFDAEPVSYTHLTLPTIYSV